MRNAIFAYGFGLLFGLGLVVSQMVDPAKVIGFLDLFGNWDPSLAFVMGGALGVAALGFRFVLKQPAPLYAERFALPTARDIDLRLLTGAGLFGVGWGMSGLCPGPAVTGLSLGGWVIPAFLVAMVAGMVAARAWPAGGGAAVKPAAE